MQPGDIHPAAWAALTMRSSPVSKASLPASTLAGMRSVIDARLRELLPRPQGTCDRVGMAMHAAAMAPGGRCRPLLMLLAGRGLSSESRALLDLACAVEMVHAASQFLDDLPCMGYARQRSSNPAIDARFDQRVAMLAALALRSVACAVVASAPGLPGSLRAKLVQVLCEASDARALVGGQSRDLPNGKSTRPASDLASHIGGHIVNASARHTASISEQQTGALFAAAMEMAALAARVPNAARRALGEAARELGRAVRLRGDLQEACDELAERMMDRHPDKGKSTFGAQLGRDAVQRRLDTHLAQASGHLREAFEDNAGLNGVNGVNGVIGLMLAAIGEAPPDADEPGLHITPARYARATGQAVTLALVR